MKVTKKFQQEPKLVGCCISEKSNLAEVMCHALSHLWLCVVSKIAQSYQMGDCLLVDQGWVIYEKMFR